MTIYRKEEKYIISPVEYVNARELLKILMCQDANSAPGNGYWIRSLYFDTPGDRDYWQKTEGISERHKYRVRIYDLKSKTAKLEIKNKKGTDTWKETVSISRDEVNLLIHGAYDFLVEMNNEVSLKTYYYLKKEGCLPKVMIDYEREAFSLNFHNIRITFDKNIRAGKSVCMYGSGIPMTGILPNNQIVMEVKYNTFLPGHIRSLLCSLQMTKLSVSKYCICRNIVG